MGSHPLSTPIPLIVQYAMNQGALIAEMEVVHGLNNMDFCSPRLTWLELLLTARYASSRN